MSNDEICFLPAWELGEQIRSRRLSAFEVVQAFLDQIERVNPSINAYVTVCAEQALAEARKADERIFQVAKPEALHGVPFSVKDLVFTAGVRTTSGSRIYENHIPSEDALAVSRLRSAGAILLGKTNTPEFGYKATTENPLFGPSRNPWDTEKTPGGSSGGAAAATAAGLSPLSVGTDGGGSIRIPASFCGVFGLKPTFGRVPTLPGFGGWRTLSHTGPMTRTVRDAALMLDVMAGPHELDRTSIPRDSSSFLAQLQPHKRRLRLGYSAALGFARVEDELKSIVESTLSEFERMGHAVEEAKVDLSLARSTFMTIVLAENAGAYGRYLDKHSSVMDEGLVKFIEAGLGLSAIDYLAAARSRDSLAAQLATFFTECDLLLTPTVAVVPFPIGEAPRAIAGMPAEPIDWIPFTYPFNLTGNPAASLPCGQTLAGVPVGLQIVGPRHSEGLVLNLCAQFEAARPWSHRRPPTTQNREDQNDSKKSRS